MSSLTFKKNLPMPPMEPKNPGAPKVMLKREIVLTNIFFLGILRTLVFLVTTGVLKKYHLRLKLTLFICPVVIKKENKCLNRNPYI